MPVIKSCHAASTMQMKQSTRGHTMEVLEKAGVSFRSAMGYGERGAFGPLLDLVGHDITLLVNWSMITRRYQWVVGSPRNSRSDG